MRKKGSFSFRYIGNPHAEDVLDHSFFKGENYGFVRLGSEYNERGNEVIVTGIEHASRNGSEVFKKHIKLPMDEKPNFYGILHFCLGGIKKVAWPENEILDEKYNPLHKRVDFWLYPALSR